MTRLLGVYAYALTMLQLWIAPQPSVRNDSIAMVGMPAISVYEAWHLGVRTGAKLGDGKLGFRMYQNMTLWTSALR